MSKATRLELVPGLATTAAVSREFGWIGKALFYSKTLKFPMFQIWILELAIFLNCSTKNNWQRPSKPFGQRGRGGFMPQSWRTSRGDFAKKGRG
jgi:hypothetical protein